LASLLPKLPAEAAWYWLEIAASQRIYLVSTNYVVVCLNHTGRELWRSRLPVRPVNTGDTWRTLEPLGISTNGLFSFRDKCSVFRLDSRGRRVPTLHLAGIDVPSAIAAMDGSTYYIERVGTEDNGTYNFTENFLNKLSSHGRLVWRQPSSAGLSALAMLPSGDLLVSNGGALDVHYPNGKLKWSSPLADVSLYGEAKHFVADQQGLFVGHTFGLAALGSDGVPTWDWTSSSMVTGVYRVKPGVLLCSETSMRKPTLLERWLYGIKHEHRLNFVTHDYYDFISNDGKQVRHVDGEKYWYCFGTLPNGAVLMETGKGEVSAIDFKVFPAPAG